MVRLCGEDLSVKLFRFRQSPELVVLQSDIKSLVCGHGDGRLAGLSHQVFHIWR